MERLKYKKGIYNNNSIEWFDDLSKTWILDDSIYYIGSYIYDINNVKQGESEHWAGDVNDPKNNEKEKEKARIVAEKDDYKKLYEVFSRRDNDFKPSITITECLQKQFLLTGDKIFHLFRKEGKNCCETIISLDSDLPLSTEEYNYQHEQISDIHSLLSEKGRKNISDIESSLAFHYKLIKEANDSHIYFFPSVLDLASTFLFNVSTVISPSELMASDLNSVQVGLQISTSSLMSDTVRYLHKLAQNEAIKSAKVAIMSRNMSHNLGSHVMSYLKHHLSSVKDMLNDGVLSNFFNNEQELIDLIRESKWKNREENVKKDTNGKQDVLDSIDKSALPFLVGLGQFISYLQERQDFIATIATDYVPYYSSVNFKDFVYDELNIDKRYNRHPDRKNQKPDNILLGNIARSEGLGRLTCPTDGEKASLSDIVLKFRTTFTGDPVVRIDAKKNMDEVDPLDWYENDAAVERAKEELKEMRDYDFSLPGGIVGRQALFSIIENVIRNAAKHGNWRTKGKLELTIDIFSRQDVLNENPDKWLCDRLRDDRPDDESLSLKEVLKRYYCVDNLKSNNDLFFVTLTDNLCISTKSLHSLRKALIEKYVDDETSRMINANKGIKEMRISAAWLRSIDDKADNYVCNMENYDKGDKSWLKEGEQWNKVPPVLYVRMSKDVDNEKHLQYIFGIVRPQKIAFISPTFANISDEVNSILSKKAWKVFTPKDYVEYINKSFDFIVYDDSLKEVNEEYYDRIRRYSPHHFIKLSDLVANLSENNQDSDRYEQAKSIFDQIKGWINGEKVITDAHKKLDAALLLLYKLLSQWDNNEMIYIHDETAQMEYNKYQPDENTDEGERKTDNVTFKISESHAKYRYVTHLEEKEQFRRYVIDKKSEVFGSENEEEEDKREFVFSEGITGNNSTDRLVRNEKLTETWFFKHLYAMKQKVAIFDERMFSKAFGLEETDFTSYKIEGWDNSNEKVNDNKKRLKEKYPEYKDIIDRANSPQNINIILNKYRMEVDKNLDKGLMSARNHIGATFAYKNIYVFSILRSIENPHIFNLYGYNPNNFPESNFADCVKLASISWVEERDDDPKLIITPYTGVDVSLLKNFNFISIHQGLLDKLYGVFGIKENSQAKEILTRDFYAYFTGDDNKTQNSEEKTEKSEKCNIISMDTILYKDENGVIHFYLPGMIIHSGRSKPSEYDMPQQLPFIPFSAIEHAVLDCKYSLVELLKSARYE